ncbi:darobactin export ABC transporter periplasmic adaptor subunit [uncultured Cedecea sp.]|uniref:darobactin export ABC transporter periplasmic adaptor subunit n=1 Tax=uncultured Cedecea sp. TaxID=988762 RepID=UPI002601AA48|nr:darobactin export ABC transporter periplasmic adaptor subunit [uncultured Cedecea sp.]
MDIQLDNKNTAHRLAKGLVALALILFALLFLWLITLFRTEKITRIPLASITLHSVQRGTFTDRLVTRAVAIPGKSVMVTSERGGTITTLRQVESSKIKKGDLIAQLSNDDFVLQVTSRIADVTEQINNLRNIRRLLEKDDLETHLAQQDAQYQTDKRHKEVVRKKVLYERGIMEKATYEQLLDELTYWKKRNRILTTYQEQQESVHPLRLTEIEASLNYLEKLIKQTEKSLEKLTITAPIDGILSPLTMKIGQQIKAGEQIATLDNTGSYYFETLLSEYYLDKIKPQDSVIAHYAGTDIPLIIISVSSQVENGKFIARFALAHPQLLSLKRGQSVDLQISLATTSDVLHVPSNAVFIEEKSTSVYLYDEKQHRAFKTAVVIKRQGEIESEITSGVSSGQQVVVFTDSHIAKSNIIEFE